VHNLRKEDRKQSLQMKFRRGCCRMEKIARLTQLWHWEPNGSLHDTNFGKKSECKVSIAIDMHSFEVATQNREFLLKDAKGVTKRGKKKRRTY